MGHMLGAPDIVQRLQKGLQVEEGKLCASGEEGRSGGESRGPGRGEAGWASGPQGSQMRKPRLRDMSCRVHPPHQAPSLCPVHKPPRLSLEAPPLLLLSLLLLMPWHLSVQMRNHCQHHEPLLCAPTGCWAPAPELKDDHLTEASLQH